LEAAENFSYTVRGWPVVFKPISSFKWVNVTKLSYGVPDEAISAALGPFGPIKLIKSEQYLHVYTGVRNVLMEVARDIPVRFRIAGHWCSIYYKGQKRPCFTCGQEGHISSKCPSKLQDEQHVVNELVQQVVQELGPGDVGGGVDLPTDEVVIPVDPSTTIVGHTLTIPPVDNDVNVGVSDKHPTSDVSIPVSAEVNDKGSLGPQNVGEVDKAASVNDESGTLEPDGADGVNASDGANAPSEGTVDALSQRARSKRRRSPPARSRSPMNKERKCGDISSSEFSDDDIDSRLEDLFSDAISDPVVTDGHELLATVMANDILDTPLTQFMPNLPGKVPGGKSISVPVDSQASEESRVIAAFFYDYQGKD
jgi:hypothetical protein